ncbi:MAG: hydrolase [Phycisphaerae bacterium]|nr:hydrolase [Phycisphaerae bacterium]
MLRANRLDANRAFVLLIDVQEKLLPSIRGHENIVASIDKLLEVVRIFELPVIVTEQYPKGIGRTDARLLRRLESAPFTLIEKMAFSACGEDPVRDALRELDRSQCILVGIEAHVCVQQTALDLRSQEYDVFVCADAVGSRGRVDFENALHRMRQEGAYVTTVESAVFELCERCDTGRFKSMIDVIKCHPPQD